MRRSTQRDGKPQGVPSSHHTENKCPSSSRPQESPHRQQSPSAFPHTMSAAAPSQVAIAKDRPAPLFLRLSDHDARFTPFSGDGAQRPGDLWADSMIRDQIVRCQAIRGKALSDADKDVIRAYYAEMSQRRAPREDPEPSTVYSADELAAWGGSNSGGGSNSSNESNRTRSSRGYDGRWVPPAAASPGLWVPPSATTGNSNNNNNNNKHDAEIASMVRALGDELLDTACKNIGDLMREKQMAEDKFKTLTKELQTVKSQLAKGNGTEPPLGASISGSDPPQAVRCPHPLPVPRQPQHIQSGWINVYLVMLAITLWVWLVTEAMLHSKRLSDGTGPFINGGYNGLGSVVIFGTWKKFILFNAASTYLGVVAVLRALRM
ncbi:hypothetical protein C7999DRAFT_12464 [Corynascus novoguineensis]|uniref:Uncharacterized protein n=1 Tax=Corynascus novoguineensis TaxID=1126955 RepID=A0AAN7CWS1_9PEZI|nr:hypothetical protein C7999DRAFT_12464 [Corynascus novoguineensis]